MADFNRCISAIKAAAGRDLSDDEIASVLEKLHKTALDIKAGRTELPVAAPRSVRAGPNAASVDQVFRQAAEIEARRMVEDAELKVRRMEMDAHTLATRHAEVQAMKDAGLAPVEAVKRLLVNHPDGRADQFSLESRALGVSQYLKSQMQETWLALGNGITDYFQRADKARALIQEMRGVDSGDAMAKKGAQAWLKVAESARQWFNDRGGKVGHLEDWGLPQHHSQDLVARASAVTGGAKVPDAAANRAAWVDFVMPLLDRERYIDTAGNPIGEPGVREMLAHAWDTIATGGASKLTPGAPRGTGARANRHAEERQIHFKDADSLLAYWDKFGDKTLPDILMGHLESMAKDIAFVEHFGSNPNGAYRMLRDAAEVEAKTSAPQSVDKTNKALSKLDRLYNYAAGITQPVASQSVARTFDLLRNLNTAGKLGSAMWASLIGDKVMFEAMGRVNNLPAFKLWWNELRLMNPANAGERRVLRRQALMLDYMTQAMSRFGDELGKNSLSAKVANGVMRISGMSAVNEWRRGAWALTAMDAIGHQVATKEFANVGKHDMRLLQSYGITDGDWKVWKLADLSDLGHGNKEALTPEAIMQIPDEKLRAAGFDGDLHALRRDATIKLLGALTSESHVAVIEPGWAERAAMYGGLQRGDIRDELTRSFWQFKAFPLTQFERILQVGLSRPTTNGKVAFLTSMPVAMTMAGAMLIQVQQLLAGKDPQPMDNWKFWGAAFLKGGSLGLYGDFLFSQSGTTRQDSGPLEAVSGPTIGAAADMVVFLAKAPGLIKEGKDPQLAAKALNIAKGFVPGSNLWYTKAATDHLIVQQAQEALNPGYLAGMRARTLREFGNDWWWKPGDAAPSRAPDLSNALPR